MKKLLVILLVLGMAAPVMAADWNFYGNARMNIGSYARDKNFVGSGTWGAGDGVNDDTDTYWHLQSNSRIGANVKASDAVSGRFELGLGSSVALRLIYGTWNFGAGWLRVGQDYTPADILYSNQIGAIKTDGDEDMLSTGMTYESRKPQIKLGIQGFELALIEPATGAPLNLSGNTYNGTDTTLPKIEAAYTFATDMFSIKPYVGYNSFDVETTGANQTSKSISSTLYGLAFKVMLGPAYINGNVVGGSNLGNYGIYTITPSLAIAGIGTASTANAVIDTGNSVQDADRVGGALVVGFKVNDMFTLEGGYGMVNDEVKAEGVTAKTSISTYYIQAAITLAPGVVIIPEYGLMDMGDLEVTGVADQDLGNVSYIAAKMQINF